MRRQKEVNQDVPPGLGGYQPVADNLEVKEVRVGARWYVICRNSQEALKDAVTWEALLDKLRQMGAKQGPKTVIG